MLIYEFGTSRFQICKSPDKSILLLPRKIFDFCARYDDAGTRVPARKFHTRPGYINTRIFTALKHTTKKNLAQLFCLFAYFSFRYYINMINVTLHFINNQDLQWDLSNYGFHTAGFHECKIRKDPSKMVFHCSNINRI